MKCLVPFFIVLVLVIENCFTCNDRFYFEDEDENELEDELFQQFQRHPTIGFHAQQQ